MTTATATLDVREIPARERDALVLSRLEALPAGQALQLVDATDPQALRREIDHRVRGQFTWSRVESGPDVWRVRIRRIGTPIAAD